MSDIEINEMIEEMKLLYLDDSNSIKEELGSILKIISIDLIVKNNYYNITEDNIIPEKIYIKNQNTGKSIYIIVKNIKGFKKNKKSISFKTIDNKILNFRLY